VDGPVIQLDEAEFELRLDRARKDKPACRWTAIRTTSTGWSSPSHMRESSRTSALRLGIAEFGASGFGQVSMWVSITLGKGRGQRVSNLLISLPLTSCLKTPWLKSRLGSNPAPGTETMSRIGTV
jgi:hypothetical protein